MKNADFITLLIIIHTFLQCSHPNFYARENLQAHGDTVTALTGLSSFTSKE